MSETPTGSPSLRWFSVLFVLFALLCGPLMLTEREGPYTWDESSWHLPAIRQIRSHWPALDANKDSLSATAPGYHYFLASVAFVTGTERLSLRLVNFAVSAAVLALLWRVWPPGVAPQLPLLALLPLTFSNFFVKSASFVVTDNAALLAATGALCALFFSQRPTSGIQAGLLAGAAVFVRQSTVWLVAPLTMHLCQPGRRTWQWVALAFPIAVLLWLCTAWGGLVPPAWQQVHYGSSRFVPAAGVYLLAVLALLAPVYYTVTLTSDWRDDFRGPLVLIGLIAGLALTLAGPTMPDETAGRWGGYLWNLAALLPAWNARSAVFLILAPLGGVMLAVLARRLWRETGSAALPWLAAFFAWSAAGLANRQVFHRYFEPTILVLLIGWLALIVRSRLAQSRASFDLRPLTILTLAQLVITLVTAHGRTFGFL